jgi:hypothetical protein
MRSKPIKIQIREYNLVAYSEAIAKSGKDGYVISDTNEGYPRQFIGEFFTEMILKEDDDVQEVPEVKEQRAAGRPRKQS